MKTKDILQKTSNLNFASAIYFIENLSGLDVEIISKNSFSALYNVKNNDEINKLSCMMKSLTNTNADLKFNFN